MRLAGLGLALMLAACGQSASDKPAPRPSATPLPPVIQGGWTTVFGDAKASIDLFQRLGLRPGPYEKSGDSYRSVATPTPMSDPSAKPADVAAFVVTGDAKTLQTVAFSLDLVGRDAPAAKEQFDRWIGQAMSQMGVAGAAPVRAALKAEKPATGDVSGATYAVTKTQIDGGRRLTVTFSRAAGNPGPIQPRK